MNKLPQTHLVGTSCVELAAGVYDNGACSIRPGSRNVDDTTVVACGTACAGKGVVTDIGAGVYEETGAGTDTGVAGWW